MHHDASASSYGRGSSPAVKSLAFGRNWVVLSFWLPLPWDLDRGTAIPDETSTVSEKPQRGTPTRPRPPSLTCSRACEGRSGWSDFSKTPRYKGVAENSVRCSLSGSWPAEGAQARMENRETLA